MLVKVGATLVSGNRGFLLVKSKKVAGEGLWNNPGGRLEKGESFRKCAVRETKEESGYEVKLGRLLLTTEFNETKKLKVIKKVYVAEIVSGDPGDRWANEIEEVRWFKKDGVNKMNETDFTFGAIQSINDYSKGTRGKVYYPERIA